MEHWNMSKRSERVSAQVTEETKKDFKIAAMRREMKEAELLRQLIDEFLDGEEIPQEVREYFLAEMEDAEGNPNPPQTQTAD